MKKILLLAFIYISFLQLSAQSSGDYRSKASGNWNETSSWETYNGSSWVDASSSPTSSDGAITILNGHTITITVTLSIDQFTIDNGGTIIINSNITVTVSDGIGSDLTINGTLTNNGTISRGGSASFTIGNGGKYIHATTSSANANAWSSINTNSDFEYQNTSSFSLSISYGNLIFNTGGNVTIGAASNVSVSGNLTVKSGCNLRLVNTGSTNSTMTVIGDFLINGTFTGNVGGSGIATLNIGGSISSGSFSAGSGSGGFLLNFTGGSSSAIFSPNSTFTTNGNITIAVGKSVSLGQALTISLNNSITISGALDCSTYEISGAGVVTIASGATLKSGHSNGINGNITTSGTNSFSTSANYRFTGSSSQVTGASLPTTVNNLTINNSSGVTLTSSTTVNGTLTLTSGNITTGSNTLTIGSSGSVSRSSGHVIGSLKKSLSSGTATFEVGTTNGYAPVNFANISGTGDFTVKTVSGKHPNAVGNNVLSMYWTLTNGGITSADLQFTYLDGDVTGTEGNYAIGKYSSGSWTFPSTSLNTTNNTASTSNISSFSDFTLGEVSALPVELNMFAAKVKNNSVQLIWSTATEVNNYGFEIERKCSNGDWKKIGFVQGHGNSNSPKNYSYSDQPLGDVTFKYRLKQVDFDGTFEYSNEVGVKLDEIKQFVLEQNYPNPFNPTTTIRFSLPVAAEVSISVFNLLGERVAQLLNANLNEGYHEVTFDGSSLTSGIYFYQLRAGDFKATKKFIITK